MIVQSVRLGQLNIPDDKIIHMEKPILGFESLKRFCLIEVEELRPFLWLHAVEDPSVAFLVVNPRVFVPDYRIEVNSKEIAELNVANVAAVETYVVVTIPEEPEHVSINLQGPVLINTENNRAKQLVLVNSEYPVRYIVLEGATMASREPVGV